MVAVVVVVLAVPAAAVERLAISQIVVRAPEEQRRSWGRRSLRNKSA
jgi:hypothetical protein